MNLLTISNADCHRGYTLQFMLLLPSSYDFIHVTFPNIGWWDIRHDLDLDPSRNGSGVANLALGQCHLLYSVHLLNHTSQEGKIGPFHQWGRSENQTDLLLKLMLLALIFQVSSKWEEKLKIDNRYCVNKVHFFLHLPSLQTERLH